MNQFIIVLFILITSTICYAQTPTYSLDYTGHIDKGGYIKDENNFLDNFVGTWVYSDAHKTFTVVLEKEEHFLFDLGDTGTYYYYVDILHGRFKYEENGNVIINTLGLDDPTNFTPIIGEHMVDGSTVKLAFRNGINDFLAGDLYLSLTTDPGEISWTLEHTPGSSPPKPATGDFDFDFVVPLSVTLVKQ